MNMPNEQTKGFIYALSAFLMWGFLPLFFGLFGKGVSAYEILAHRIIWSFALMAAFLLMSKKAKNIKILLQDTKTAKMLFLSGTLISLNWGVYVYAVNNGKILESSLGSFINPLVNMLLGVIIFKEKLGKMEIFGVCMVVLAVSVQVLHFGDLPLVAIFSALSFAFYAAVRKSIKIAALDGLFIETMLVVPFALCYVLYLAASGQSHFGLNQNSILFVLSSFVTVVPLMAFNAATTRINLSTIGYLQYLSPSIGMLCAVFVFGETLDIYRLASFCLIWFALLVVALGRIRH
ncbi:EamA family transporter RarD [Campylobacter curvus]|uniref:EamA family transporter RarD n=1 Tax=Campylobacter curvus TaxID=200 RepID=UPI00146FCB6C|nr:EamA family transporter RarD [Campylobacter curvus]